MVPTQGITWLFSCPDIIPNNINPRQERRWKLCHIYHHQSCKRSSGWTCSHTWKIMNHTNWFTFLVTPTLPEHTRVWKYQMGNGCGGVREPVANYVQTECQFRYCGTAIPFLTVRSTARWYHSVSRIFIPFISRRYVWCLSVIRVRHASA